MGNVNEPLRFQPRSGPHAPHAVKLSGMRAAEQSAARAPLLIERRDQDFVDGLWDDLRAADALSRLTALAPRRVKPRGFASPLARLYAPAQRVFNLAIFEAFCDHAGVIAQPGNALQPFRTGTPRLDPAKIESSGMVLRRVLAAPVDGARYEAWVRSGTKAFGWDAIEPEHEDDDPAADRRALAVSIGNPALNARLASNVRVRSALSRRLARETTAVHEHTMPIFVAPPDVAQATGKTVLFGTLQVASNEQSEAPAAAPGYGRDAGERALLAKELPTYITASGPRTFVHAGETFDAAWALRVGKGNAADVALHAALGDFIGAVQKLAVVFDAFGTSQPSRRLFDALNALQVEYDEPRAGGGIQTRTEKAGDFFLGAYKVVLLADAGASFKMPHRVSNVGAAQGAAIFEAVLASLDEQYRKLKPAKGRFEADSREVESRYVVRAFVRLKPERPGCPPQLVWSPYSEEFTIAPWYESAGQPPTTVELPDLFDRDALKALKPNVAFTVPPKLAKLLTGDAKDLAEGKGDGGDGLGLAWICSFSIPVITICAFIVLSIFLSLLNLIFWWLPFLKICIPFPKKLP
jgi:hypothetical protein